MKLEQKLRTFWGSTKTANKSLGKTRYNSVMKKFVANPMMLGAFYVVLFVAFGLFLFYMGDQFALAHLNIRQTTPNQMANAMQQDDFYSTFRENTLVFHGEVTGASVSGTNTLVTIKTSTAYGVTCELSQNQAKPGQAYTFAAEAYTADRQPMGVLLHHCRIF